MTYLGQLQPDGALRARGHVEFDGGVITGKDVMIRTIRIVDNEKSKLDVRQVFDRV